ncbi:MAG: hypothetical protein H6861_07340 [Rhodospirillales bacterium]|nr:hypothetical protein [Rhodospirillales bacterium]
MKTLTKFSILALAGISTLSLNACGPHEPFREQVAARLASPVWMIKRPVETGPFILTAFERMHERGRPAALYIEGAGEADETMIKGKMFNPTPRNPVALHLASMDKADNVAYLARPCQYTGLRDAESACDESYWGDAQFNAETVASYHNVLDNIKARYGVTEFNIVGYNSGATLAAMLAGQRKDIKSLRTVAGRFDMAALSGALPALRGMPQHHFIGGQDELAPPAELENYLQALGDTPCVDYTLIQEAEHEKGWVNKWPELLKNKVPECSLPPAPEFIPIEKPEPIYVPRMGVSKK